MHASRALDNAGQREHVTAAKDECGYVEYNDRSEEHRCCYNLSSRKQSKNDIFLCGDMSEDNAS